MRGADSNLPDHQRGASACGIKGWPRHRHALPEQLGDLKSKILESVYSIRDIQIFGAGQRRMQVVEQANGKVNQAALGLTLHRQTIASFELFLYLAKF